MSTNARQRAADGVLACALVLASVSGWFTWTRSGSADRNSYESLRAAQRLGIEELTPFRVIWFCVPVISFAVVVLLLTGFSRWALALGALGGFVVLVFGVGMLLTPVASGIGPWVASVCGVVALVVPAVRFAQGSVWR